MLSFAVRNENFYCVTRTSCDWRTQSIGINRRSPQRGVPHGRLRQDTFLLRHFNSCNICPGPQAQMTSHYVLRLHNVEKNEIKKKIQIQQFNTEAQKGTFKNGRLHSRMCHITAGCPSGKND